MKIAKLLLNMQNEYNGHFQTVIKGLTVKQGKKICKELEEYTNQRYSFVLELWSDGNFTIYQKDFWNNRTNGNDRIILATDG
jgi:hypothetical protein